MAEHIYVVSSRHVSRPVFPLKGVNVRTRILSKHATLEQANEAARERVEEECVFAAFPSRFRREESVNALGGFECECQINAASAVEGVRARFTVSVNAVECAAEKAAHVAALAQVEDPRRVLKRNPKGFKMLLPYGKPQGLRRGSLCAKIMFCGELETMGSRVANHATEVYGGKAVDKHFHADYAVVGRDPYEHACGAEFLDEEGFYALLKAGLPRDKHLKDVRYDEQGHLVGGADAAEPVGLYTRTNSDAGVAAAAANGHGHGGHGHGGHGVDNHGVDNSQDSGYGGEASGGADDDEPLAKKQKTWM